jgi:riboflavin kinase/FMN adenylyltransferase
LQVFRSFAALPAGAAGAVYAIGNFDGLHRGHRAVLTEAARIAAKSGAKHGVVTFEPHPRSHFAPGDPPFRITPLERKTELLSRWGVDLLAAVPFDATLAATTAADFVERHLVGGLQASHLVVGHDFAFGQKRAGNVDYLRRRGAALGFGVSVVPAQLAETGALYSSRSVREFLGSGRPRDAAELLGRWWCVRGSVRRGDARGRELGYPTANIQLGEHLQPSLGIYAVRAAVVEAGARRWHDAAANLGVRPTFDGKGVLLEVHLLDFSGDLYGRTLDVAFVEYLRPEERFPNVDSLKRQMAADCHRSRALLADRRNALERFGEAP